MSNIDIERIAKEINLIVSGYHKKPEYRGSNNVYHDMFYGTTEIKQILTKHLLQTEDETWIEKAHNNYITFLKIWYTVENSLLLFRKSIEEFIPKGINSTEEHTSVTKLYCCNDCAEGNADWIKELKWLWSLFEGNTITTPSVDIEKFADEIITWVRQKSMIKSIQAMEICKIELVKKLAHLSHTTGGELKPMICIDKEKDGATAVYATKKDWVTTIEKIDRFWRVPSELEVKEFIRSYFVSFGRKVFEEDGVSYMGFKADDEQIMRDRLIDKMFKELFTIPMQEAGTWGVDRESIS